MRTIILLASILLWSCSINEAGHVCVDDSGIPPPVLNQRSSVVMMEAWGLPRLCLIVPDGPPCSMESQATGVVIRNVEQGAFVLTNVHHCQDNRFSPFHPVRHRAIDIDGNIYPNSRVFYAGRRDLCVMYVPGMDREAVRFSRVFPEIGTAVYAISAPFGTYHPHSISLFRGYISGRGGVDLVHHDKTLNEDVYSLPVSPGSSGSPVFDCFGRVVGIIHAGVMNRNHGYSELAYGIPLEAIVAFIDELRAKSNWDPEFEF